MSGEQKGVLLIGHDTGNPRVPHVQSLPVPENTVPVQ